jgi:hypothetical protein
VTARELGRRLDALEQTANDLRRREMRELVASLPEASDLTSAELEEATDEGLHALEEWRALKHRGLTDRRIILLEAERIATKLGQTAEDVLAGAGLDPEAYR